MLHLNSNAAALYHWNESQQAWQALPSTVDLTNHVVTATTTELGDFQLQAPLQCSDDTSEPDDTRYGAFQVHAGAPYDRLFDVPLDQDWFWFDATAGTKYTLWTSDLASGVDTVLELYDADGSTILVSDDNSGGGLSSRITWIAPLRGSYFIRVVPKVGSHTGCDATYRLNFQQQFRIFLPFVLK